MDNEVDKRLGSAEEIHCQSSTPDDGGSSEEEDEDDEG